jgi:hypothetical protein
MVWFLIKHRDNFTITFTLCFAFCKKDRWFGMASFLWLSRHHLGILGDPQCTFVMLLARCCKWCYSNWCSGMLLALHCMSPVELYEGGLISLWLYKENDNPQDWKKCIYSTSSPWAPHIYDFVVLTSLTHPRKMLSVVLQTTCGWNKKSQRLISTPTYDTLCYV